MEGYCSTGQSPQWAVVPMEDEEVNEGEKQGLLMSYLKGIGKMRGNVRPIKILVLQKQ
jgi:hypothetical protein